ncbi:MAG: sugar phosphate isomerase/epimerase [Thermodesulfovibrionia bacterium]|nr:sugar phosphate isomerase/epimerase [Thermodesulfovibrionia bacterium]
MIKPYINVPLDKLGKYLSFIRKEELNLEIYFGSIKFDSLKKKDIIKLKNRLDYNPQLTLHAPFMDLSPGAVDPRVRELTIQRFSHVLDFAEILQPKVVVFHSGYEKWKYDGRVDIWLKGCLKTWIPLNKKASDLGVKIAIENIFEDEPSNLKLLIEEINSKNFGLCFDTGHFHLFSKMLLSDWLDIIKLYIIELHLHDNLRIKDLHLAIGEGSFDFRTLFRKLQGKNLIYTIEAHSKEGVIKSMERLRGYLK